MDEELIDQVVAAQRNRFPKAIKSWSYEQLEWEVTGNVVYRRFCRIDGTKVPDAKTMSRQNKLLEGPALRAISPKDKARVAVRCRRSDHLDHLRAQKRSRSR